MNEANEALMSGGVRSAKFEHIGTWIEGFVYEPPTLRQRIDINTKQPMTWPDGNPRMEIRVVLMIDDRQDDDDDGLRALYVRGDMQRAVRDAVKTVGAAGLEVGGKLRVKHTGVGPPKQAGFNGPKLFEAQYRAPEASPVPLPEFPDPLGPRPSAYEPPAPDDDLPF